MEDYDIVVTEDGDLRFVYADELAEIFVGERQLTARASNVEPHPTAGYGWYADMYSGPVLGANGTVIYRWEFGAAGSQEHIDALWNRLAPFPSRAEAHAAEREWLRKERGL